MMAAASGVFFGAGPHSVYHSFEGNNVVAAVYDNYTHEQIKGATIKAWYGYVEVLLPVDAVGGANGCRVVVVG